MKILLVLPAAENVRVTRESPVVPPRSMLRFSVLSLTTIAALTPPRHEVRIVDENVEPLDLNSPADLVGITFMTALAPRAYEIAARFRARGVPVVAGGYHSTLVPGEVMSHFDAVVAGDAEGAWEALIQDLEAGCLQRRYSAPPCSTLRPPVPRRELLAHTARHYVTIHAVQTGRGCNHGCRYCSIAAFHGRVYRHRPVAEVLEEVRALPRDFIFVDDNIAADREYALSLFRSLAPLRKRWVAQCSIEAADDPALLAALRHAGCRGLFVGIETTDSGNLAAVGKSFNDTTSYPRRVRAFHAHGIGVFAGIMVGLDRDGPHVFANTLRFLQRSAIDGLQLNILTPLPGTPLFDDFRLAGRITDADWSHYDFRHVVINPAGMTAGQLQQGADWLYVQFYRMDRLLIRFVRTALGAGLVPAWLGLRLGLTYRYDNRRDRLAANASARSDPPTPRKVTGSGTQVAKRKSSSAYVS